MLTSGNIAVVVECMGLNPCCIGAVESNVERKGNKRSFLFITVELPKFMGWLGGILMFLQETDLIRFQILLGLVDSTLLRHWFCQCWKVSRDK